MATKKSTGKKTRRTTMRSSTGTKLYAVRDASGKFKDIQTYKRAQGADIKRSSAAESGGSKKLAKKKAAKKAAGRKKVAAKRKATKKRAAKRK